MTIRKERRRLEKRLKRSLLAKKGLTMATTVVAGSTIAPNLVLAAETATSDDAKNQAEITENQVSGGNSSTDSTGDSIQSSADETISTEETATPQETITEDTAVVETPIVAAPALARTSIFSARADTSGFIAKASGYATEVAAANDLYASVMIAQAILESGWGTSTLTTQANNMFGIKGSYNGQYVEMATLEDNGSGNYYQIIAKFRKYPSLRESFQDNAYVLRNTSFAAGSYYYSGAWKSNTRSYTEATAWLQGRYATDTSYASKLNNLIATYNLTQYDSGSSAGNGDMNNVETPVGENAIQKQMKTTASMNIRSDASTTAAVTGSLTANTTFTAVAVKTGTSVNGNTNWYKVSGKGWVSGAYLTEVNSGSTSGNANDNTVNTGINQKMKTTATLNIRSTASTSGSIVGSLSQGSTVTATAVKTGTSVNGNTKWYYVSGKGWVSGAYLTEVNSGSTSGNTNDNTANTGINQKMKTTATLNIRSTASTNGSIVGSLSQGSTVTVTAVKNGTSVNGNTKWYYVSGKGWVSGAYLTSDSSSSSNTSNTGDSINQKMKTTATLNIRSTASTSGSIVGSLSQGSTVTATAVKNGTSVNGNNKWYYVSGKGWVSGAYLTKTATNASSSNSSANNSSSTKYHTVKSGDSLWSLAQKYGSSIDQITSWNRLSNNIIYVGQKLIVK
ncbi:MULTISPECIES: SH3 domain-containing protein [Enterococcus]|uniref:SH3 domain-containing protein n=1 Tax=Enterococcus TaxID=1350 RepID=UPI0010C1DB52|nr:MULTISPECIES: SH3 domain-containing protein [Enterococcus]MDO6298587.1 SH3 domain-containing protein [Enterococcus gallinarum]MDT2701082.1 SH3 domain-containing protein [Enterococcus gallinarum]MDV7823486.1 SH3 domain-containing protein [Enterococcus gallinarum]MDV7874666.1 SH3 domain-containing protein [Enterococcus gallinarum]MDY4071466.1 SH3 domain-containing protein [Enterococcus gallinarum]